MEVGAIESRKKHALILPNSWYAMIKLNGLATLQEELEKEYGTVDINIQDGTINYGRCRS